MVGSAVSQRVLEEGACSGMMGWSSNEGEKEVFVGIEAMTIAELPFYTSQQNSKRTFSEHAVTKKSGTPRC